tara:strand:+ start:721 stop:1671 length:951 start_codon:yes stop_codon:yes gene_type:complete
MKKTILTILFIVVNIANAQDIHFSQFDQSSFFLNPSLLSYENHDYKVLIQNRSQWEKVGEPFKTVTFSLERINFLPEQSIGVQILNDVAGDSKLTTSGITFAYSKLVEIINKTSLSLGVSFGAFQRSISYNELIFSTPEEYQELNFWYPDISTGVSIKKVVSERLSLNSGAAFFHLYSSNQSLIGDDQIKLIRKNSFHLKTNYKLTKTTRIISKCFFSKQENNHEIILGSEVEYFVKIKKLTTINLGLFHRIKDAIIFQTGVRQENFGFLFSYDFNTSSLSNASNYQGGTELSLVYYWDLKKIIKNKKPECCPKYL